MQKKPIKPSRASDSLDSAKTYRCKSQRRILCIFPRYAPSFGTFQHAYPLMPRVRAFMPPQGLLLVAAYLPGQWQVRVIDENIRPATQADYQWAEAVLISGMHVQRTNIDAIVRAAHQLDKLTVLGGPSVSACPEYYPEVDILHVGELGDATDAMIEYLDRSIERPKRQWRLETTQRLALDQFPLPAYNMLDLSRYFLGSIQFSSGCPYQCEFCDIPELYGRRPRLKRPEQIIDELDAIVAAGVRGAIYFVDDNFIANRKAARELLPYLIEWQHDRGYPVEFACEATLNIAQWGDTLEQMREARFHTLFCGIETPEPEALLFMQKKQNLRQPIIEAVQKLNRYGMEVVAGIIIGLDTDTSHTIDHILAFIEEARIPMSTINLLYALPRTPLFRRLEAEKRILEDSNRASNVMFKLPYDKVMQMWYQCIVQTYDPDRLLDRFAYQTEMTYPNRLSRKPKVSASQVTMGIDILSRVIWNIGLMSNYKKTFWGIAGPLLKSGRIEEVIHIGLVSHHLINFTREALQGQEQACFYADPHH